MEPILYSNHLNIFLKILQQQNVLYFETTVIMDIKYSYVF